MLNVLKSWFDYRTFKPAIVCFFVGVFFYHCCLHAKPERRYASIVVNTATGKVLQQSSSRSFVYPASLTKMMTLYMVFDALEKGRLKKNNLIKVSRYAAAQEPSNIELKPGESLTVDQAILSLVCRSANDSAVALAEHLAPSEREFAQKMTQKARQLGLRDTHFCNASGLFHPKQVTTARDMARLGILLIKHFPREYAYFKRQHFSFRGKQYKNHNKLIYHRGVDGLKTGYIKRSGFNLVTSAKQSGHRLMAVVIGGETARWRDQRMKSLLDMGFQQCDLTSREGQSVVLRKGAAGAVKNQKAKNGFKGYGRPRRFVLRKASLGMPSKRKKPLKSERVTKKIYMGRKRHVAPKTVDALLLKV